MDFGFASHVPSKERAAQDRAYCQVAFAGTPDYASRDALRGIRCSPKVRAGVHLVVTVRGVFALKDAMHSHAACTEYAGCVPVW